MSKERKLYRVRFRDGETDKPTEVVVASFAPSEFFGMVTLTHFVWEDQTKFVVLPEEDATRKRFAKTETLHIPYHSLILVEEFVQEVDLKNLPFIREVPADSPTSPES